MIKLNNWIYDLEQKYERKLLKEALDQLAYEVDHEDTEVILNRAAESIDNQDEDALLDTDLWELDITLQLIEKSELVANTLENAGYQVEVSNVSNSLYAINDEGREVRISDHKRPAIVEGGIAIHEHEEGLIIDKVEVNSNVLAKVGFRKLEGNKVLYLWK
jgi:alkyl sulfatase BDS1-like metallo-beta-lactamase superfamily hydrolase